MFFKTIHNRPKNDDVYITTALNYHITHKLGEINNEHTACIF